jgi:putative membrane protein
MSVRNLAMAAGALFVSLAVVPVSPLHAQAKVKNPKPNDLEADSLRADSKFIREASAGNILEVLLGRMAERKATRPDVKQFGQRMITDHSKLEDQLKSLASTGGITLGQGPGPKHEQKIDELQKVSGKEFDRAYMNRMVRQHDDAVSYFAKEGREVHSAKLRELNADALTILQQGLSRAKEIAEKVGADTASTAHAVRTPKHKYRS